MSNAEKMVSVPRALLMEAEASLRASGMAVTLSADIRKVLDQPAEQQRGEPGGYPQCDYCGIVPDHHPWHGSGLLSGVENRHIHACDACRGRLPLHPGQHQVEPVALPDRKPESVSFLPTGWNACLDEIAKLGPLYSCPVQGEPAVPAFVMPSSENSYGFGYVDGTCIQSLRGYRDHLEDIVNAIPEGPLYTHADAGEVERLNMLLRASRTSLDNCALQIENLQTQLVERDALLREIADRIKSVMPRHAAEVLAILSASAESSAPVERDERAEFEEYALSKGWMPHMLKQKPNGHYEDWGVNPEWQALQARAALERKP